MRLRCGEQGPVKEMRQPKSVGSNPNLEFGACPLGMQGTLNPVIPNVCASLEMGQKETIHGFWSIGTPGHDNVKNPSPGTPARVLSA